MKAVGEIKSLDKPSTTSKKLAYRALDKGSVIRLPGVGAMKSLTTHLGALSLAPRTQLLGCWDKRGKEAVSTLA